MPKAIPEGLTAQHVLLALDDLDAGMEHSFGPPTGCELVHDGKRYPPKAVVGIAFRHLTGNIVDSCAVGLTRRGCEELLMSGGNA